MDTRAKIISVEEARDIAGEKEVHWVSGHFDPLLAEHAALLNVAMSHANAAAGRLLMVEVTNPAHPLLPLRARAELVAALAQVDYVVMSDQRADAPDEDITRRFIHHVHQRVNGAQR
jgi:bifunctional ADP-heptose synthase (sugar kinase/adenylyltransferase)